MRVKCVLAHTRDLPAEHLQPAGAFPRDTKLDLTAGREYVVYATLLRRDQVWFFIADDGFEDGPRRYPHHLFEIVNARVSQHWEMRAVPGDAGASDFLLAPAEWHADRWFFNNLVDGEPDAVEVFMRLKRTLDAEDAKAFA